MQRYLRIQRDGFPEFVNNYFSELDASDSTKKAYIERIYHVLSDFCSSIDQNMKLVTLSDIRALFSANDYCRRMLDKGYSALSVKNDIKAFRRMCAVVSGGEYRPVFDAAILENESAAGISVTEDEYKSFAAILNPLIKRRLEEERRFCYRDVFLVVLIRDMGLKVSECRSLNLEDIHGNALIIRRRKHTVSMDMTDAVKKALNKYLVERAYLMSSVYETKGERPLFVGNQRTRLTVRSMELIVKELFAGYPSVTAETIRKMSGIYRYRQTGSVEYVAQYLGINVLAAEILLAEVKKDEGMRYIPLP